MYVLVYIIIIKELIVFMHSIVMITGILAPGQFSRLHRVLMTRSPYTWLEYYSVCVCVCVCVCVHADKTGDVELPAKYEFYFTL